MVTSRSGKRNTMHRSGQHGVHGHVYNHLSPVLPRPVLYLMYLHVMVKSMYQETIISSFPLMITRAATSEGSLSHPDCRQFIHAYRGVENRQLT